MLKKVSAFFFSIEKMMMLINKTKIILVLEIDLVQFGCSVQLDLEFSTLYTMLSILALYKGEKYERMCRDIKRAHNKPAR